MPTRQRAGRSEGQRSWTRRPNPLAPTNQTPRGQDRAAKKPQAQRSQERFEAGERRPNREEEAMPIPDPPISLTLLVRCSVGFPI